jgi:hypothetical protein
MGIFVFASRMKNLKSQVGVGALSVFVGCCLLLSRGQCIGAPATILLSWNSGAMINLIMSRLYVVDAHQYIYQEFVGIDMKDYCL